MSSCTEEQFIDFYSHYGLKRNESINLIKYLRENEYFKEVGDLIYFDVDMEKYSKRLEQKGFNFHGHFNQVDLPKVSCFSGKVDTILMWGHYADKHKDICLSFRSINRKVDGYYLEFDFHNPKKAIRLATNDLYNNLFYDSDSYRNLFYESQYLKVNYEDHVSTQANVLVVH